MMQQQFPYNGLTQQRGKQKKKVNSSANHQKKKKKAKEFQSCKADAGDLSAVFFVIFRRVYTRKSTFHTRAHTHTTRKNKKEKSR